MTEKILNIIAENFPNGLRFDFIANKKIRRLYAEKFAEEIPADFNIEALLERHCIKRNGKFYLINKFDKEKILRLVDEIISDNVIVFYEKIFEKHRKFFEEMKIVSADVLSETLQSMSYKYFYNEDFLAMNWFITPQDLLRKYFQTYKEITLDEVEEIFPYIPLEVVKKILSGKNYSLTDSGKYILADSIQFDEEEIKTAQEKFSKEIEINGHAIFETSKFTRILEINPDISEANICTAIYEKYLADKFSRHRNILTIKGEKLSGRQLIRNYCAARDEITIEELLKYALSVGIKRDSIHYNAFEAAYKVMVRVSKDLLVNEELIKFEVKDIDTALNSFVQGKIIALRDVNDFSTFPPVEGYGWNLYLLESFLRKYSLNYTFDSPATNNSLIGAIYPKTMKFEDYLEVQAAVIRQENIQLNEESIAKFLIGKGFRKAKKKSVITEILYAAQE